MFEVWMDDGRIKGWNWNSIFDLRRIECDKIENDSMCDTVGTHPVLANNNNNHLVIKWIVQRFWFLCNSMKKCHGIFFFPSFFILLLYQTFHSAIANKQDVVVFTIHYVTNPVCSSIVVSVSNLIYLVFYRCHCRRQFSQFCTHYYKRESHRIIYGTCTLQAAFSVEHLCFSIYK